jgi:ABC-2 type transport system permease protein
MSKLFEVARQEFRFTAANKGFVVITIIGPFLILAIAVLPGLFAATGASDISDKTVGIYTPADELFMTLSQAVSESGMELVRVESGEVGRNQVMQGNLDGLLVLPSSYRSQSVYQYFSETGTDVGVIQTLESTLGRIVVTQRLQKEGLEASRITELTRQPQIEGRKLSESGDEEQDFFMVMMVALGFVMMLYMTIIFYGQIIGRSVLQEKTSKTVEIMLSSIRPIDLMVGKILGKGAAGLLQYAVWITIAAVLVQVVGPRFNLAIPESLNLPNMGFLVLFFLLAFFLYATVYATLGAGSEDEQHLNQLAVPMIFFLVLPMVFVSAIVMNPNATFSYVLSYIPFTAPIVMLTRILIATPPAWEVLLCIALMLATIAALAALGARIFRVGILMTGKRFGIGEIVKWVRYQ